MAYPQGTPSSGVYDVFTDNSFTPDDVVKAIRDNHSPVNRTTMLVSLGYQVSLIQNFVNARYLGRSALPVKEGFITSGYFDNVLCLSGSLSSDYTYVNINKHTVDVRKNQGGVCGYTYLYPMEVQLKKFGSDSWTSYFNVSGINWVTDNGIRNIRIQANRAHELTLANPSTQDDAAGYSGITRLYGNEINLQSVGSNINLVGGSITRLNFCGSNLLISGSSTAANIFVSNRLLPWQPVDEYDGTGQDLGSDSPLYRAWKNAYLQTTHTQATYGTPHGLGPGTKVFAGTFGGVCGASVNDSDYGLKVSSTYVCGNFQYLNAGVGPNKIYLRKWQTGEAAISGYFQLNDGQLEFYSINAGSGWVLTGF